MAKKMRADQLVFEQGLAQSREQAKRLIMAGQVALVPDVSNYIDGALPEGVKPELVQKAGHNYPIETEFMLLAQERFVSRGAYKLLTAIEYFGLDVHDFVCLDAGASTGGFTDCLLQHGAKKVYAADVGHAQLHEKMRADSRVVNMEGYNLRHADENLLPEKVDIMVSDVSFISLTLIIPPCIKSVKDGGLIVALIKPQFEVGPHQTEKGVVRDEAVRQFAVDKVLGFCQEIGLTCVGVIPAMIKGPKGNQEYLACWRKEKKTLIK